MIYLASSWRNAWYDTVLADLVRDGHDVYNFKHDGFKWTDVSKHEEVTVPEMSDILAHHRAVNHWQEDMHALMGASALVLLLPCGNSAHTELGYALATDTPVIVAGFGDHRLDLMYMGAYKFVDTYADIHTALVEIGQ